MYRDETEIKEGLNLTVGEILFVLAGVLFFISSIWIVSGGNYDILMTAKTVYLIGLIFLLSNR